MAFRVWVLGPYLQVKLVGHVNNIRFCPFPLVTICCNKCGVKIDARSNWYCCHPFFHLINLIQVISVSLFHPLLIFMHFLPFRILKF